MADEEGQTQDSQDEGTDNGEDTDTSGTSDDATTDDTTPVKPPVTTPDEGKLSDDQAASLKESISKDVEEKITKSVSEKVSQAIGKALGLTKAEEESLPKDAEALQKIVDDAVDARMKAQGEEADENQKKGEQARQEKINTIVNGWYQQYNMLSQQGKLPQIKDLKDPKDPGILARRNVIKYIGTMIDRNKQAGTDYTPSIADAILENPRVSEGVAGADIPVSGNTAVRESGEDFEYKDIAGKSFEQISQGK